MAKTLAQLREDLHDAEFQASLAQSLLLAAQHEKRTAESHLAAARAELQQAEASQSAAMPTQAKSTPNQTTVVCEMAEELMIELHQLAAMLQMTYGAGGEVLRSSDEDLQEHFMWGLYSKVMVMTKAAAGLCDTLNFCEIEVRHG